MGIEDEDEKWIYGRLSNDNYRGYVVKTATKVEDHKLNNSSLNQCE